MQPDCCAGHAPVIVAANADDRKHSVLLSHAWSCVIVLAAAGRAPSVRALMTGNLLLQVMKEVNNLMRVPELSATMQQMSKEMMKAGMIDEMMGDAIDDALDSEDMEEETDQEVEKASGQGLLYLRCTS